MRRTKQGWALDWIGHPPSPLTLPMDHAAQHHRGVKGAHHYHRRDIERFFARFGMGDFESILPSTMINGKSASEWVKLAIEPYRIC